MTDIPYGFTTTAREIVKGVDLTGKTAIVTGGAGGIGLETTKALAEAGAHVTIAARRVEEAKIVAESIASASLKGSVSVRRLDVADLRSVRSFVDGWQDNLDILINNAGVMAIPELQRTQEGHEMQFATNYLGHFALTRGLRPFLAKANGSRVVSVASVGSLFAPVFWDDISFRFMPYDPLLSYGQSKTACILMSVGITQNWANDGIASNSLNPGAIATNLQKHTGGLRTPEHLRKNVEQGAATTVLLAASPLLEGISGKYFDDCQEAPVVEERGSPLRGVAHYAVDPDNAERLWKTAASMLGS